METIDLSSASAYDNRMRMKEVKEFDESKIGVKGLSDSGITSIPRIFVHPPETLSDLKSQPRSSSLTQLPVVDISGINSTVDRPKIIEELREAASTWGFFQVVGHGIPSAILNRTVAAIRAFHEQPQDVKAKYYMRDEMRRVLYSTNNDLYRSKAATWHDYFQVFMRPEAPPADEIPEVCREEVLEWDKHVTTVAEMVAELLSEGLGLEKRKMKDLGLLEGRALVGTCYPYCPQPELTVGLCHHTDPGVITILLPNQVPGLQIKHEDEWVHVKPLPDALIVNIGDFLQIVSNGEYKSVEHRVLANSSKESRISVIQFINFLHENESLHFGPLPELVSLEKPAIYRNFTKQEFLDNFYTKGLDSKSLIEKMKM